MSEQHEPNITDPREAEAELLRWLDAGGFADYGFAVATLRRIIAERDAARAALQNIADQHTTTEMDEDFRDDADFECGYDAIINIARQALNGGPNAN